MNKYFNPFFWNDSPLPIEQIILLIQRVGDLGADIEEIKKLAEDINTNIDEAVKKEILALYESGELKTIVSEIVDELTNTPIKSQYLDLKRIQRHLYNKYTQGSTQSNGKYFDETPHYCSVQGACHFWKNGTGHNAIYLRPMTAPASNANFGKLIIIGDDGNVEYPQGEQTGLLEAGHGNDIIYHKERDSLFICISTWNEQTSTGTVETVDNLGILEIPLSNGISEIKEETIDGEKQIKATDWIVVDSGFAHIGGMAYLDGEFYIGGGYSINKVTAFNTENNNHTLSNKLFFRGGGYINKFSESNGQWIGTNDNSSNYNPINQNFEVTSKYIYFLKFNPDCIIRWNRVKHMYDCVYELPEVMDGKKFSLGEPESFTIDADTGNIWLYTTKQMQYTYISQHYMVQIFGGNIYNPAITPTVLVTRGGDYYRTYSNVVYVDRFTDNVNPTGGVTTPFKTIDEAAMFINYSEMCRGKFIYIYLVTASPYPSQFNGNASGIYIKEATNYADSTYPGGALIGNIFAEGTTQITIQNVRLSNRVATDAQPYLPSAWQYCLVGLKNNATFVLLGNTGVVLDGLGSGEGTTGNYNAPVRNIIHAQYSNVYVAPNITTTPTSGSRHMPTNTTWKAYVEKTKAYLESGNNNVIDPDATAIFTRGWLNPDGKNVIT